MVDLSAGFEKIPDSIENLKIWQIKMPNFGGNDFFSQN
jgi:hypothetical protein